MVSRLLQLLFGFKQTRIKEFVELLKPKNDIRVLLELKRGFSHLADQNHLFTTTTTNKNPPKSHFYFLSFYFHLSCLAQK